MKAFERYRIYYFETRRRFSADPKLDRDTMQCYLQHHGIKLCQKPARSFNNNDRVKRKNGLFKTVIENFERHDKDSDPDDIVAQASFIKINCHG